MQNIDYKDMKLVSFNAAGWNWRVSNEQWKDRLQRICAYIRNKTNNPFVIALQEVQLSGGKYLKLIVMGDFNTLPGKGLIKTLTCAYENRMINAVKNKNVTWKNFATESKSCVDYILYSAGMFRKTGVSAKATEIDYFPIADRLADHSLIIGNLSVD